MKMADTKKILIGKRILSAVLVFFIVALSIPVGSHMDVAAATTNHLDVFTVFVGDRFTVPISNAVIEFEEEQNPANRFAAVTGTDGVAEVWRITDMENAREAASFRYEITAAGYERAAGVIQIDDVANNYQDHLEIMLREWITLSGKVTDAGTALPVVGASVVVDGYMSFGQVFTGVDGSYKIENVPGGEMYGITVSHGNYEEQGLSIDLTVDGAVNNFQLLRETVSPTIDTLDISETNWTKEAVVVSGTVSDNQSGVDKVYFKKTGAGSYAEAALNGDSFSFTIPAQNYDGSYDIYCQDKAGNISAIVQAAVRMDHVAPTTMAYTGQIEWTNGAVSITGFVWDDFSGIDRIYCKKGHSGTPVEISHHSGAFSLQIPAQSFEGDYVFYSVDQAGNQSSERIVSVKMDNQEPEMPSIIFEQTAADTADDRITFGFFQAPVIVTASSVDNLSGIKEIRYSYAGTEGKYITRSVSNQEVQAATGGEIHFSFPVGTAFRGEMQATAVDFANNESQIQTVAKDRNGTEVDGVVVDGLRPVRVVTYDRPNRIVAGDTLTDRDIDAYLNAESTNSIFYYRNAFTATFHVREANFYQEDFVILVNGVRQEPTDWQNVDDVWTGSLTFHDDGEYVITIHGFADRSGNAMNDYISEKLVIDTTAPVIRPITYDAVPSRANMNGMDYYKQAKLTATIEIQEKNFRADEVVAAFTAKDILQEDVTGVVFETVGGSSIDLLSYLATRSSWTETAPGSGIWQAKFVYATDARYTFAIGYTDMADWAGDMQAALIKDHTPAEIQVEYVAPSMADIVLETVSFHVYKPKTFVRIHMTDTISGVWDMQFAYHVNSGLGDAYVSHVNTGGNGSFNAFIQGGGGVFIPNGNFSAVADSFTFGREGGSYTQTAVFEIDAQFRGYVTAAATDIAANSSAKNELTDSRAAIIVDDKNPVLQVEYIPVGADVLRFVDSVSMHNEANQATFTDANTIAYYNGAVNATVTIHEENLLEGKVDENTNRVIHNVIMVLEKTDNNGVTTRTEFVPQGAPVTVAGAAKAEFSWVQTPNTDIWKYTLPTYDDDADYVLKIRYQDLAENKADTTTDYGKYASETYTSNIITVDKTAPILRAVTYSAQPDRSGMNGFDYYKQARLTATIQIEEHNFRADEVDVAFLAEDILGYAVSGVVFESTNGSSIDLPEYLAMRSSWAETYPGSNIWQAQFVYITDANYTLDIRCRDLVSGEAHAQTTITKDNTPAAVEVEYITPSAMDVILETVTFHIYKPAVSVQIRITDKISGMWDMQYAYNVHSNLADAYVSDVNTGGSYAYNAFSEQDGKYVQNQNFAAVSSGGFAFGRENNSYTQTATVQIPPQFRGHVTATVTDVATNITAVNQLTQNKIAVIVDDKNPAVQVAYSPAGADRLRFVDGTTMQDEADQSGFTSAGTVAYYNGAVSPTVTIQEANFLEGKWDQRTDSVIHSIIMVLERTDNNGNVTETEFVPVGASTTAAGAAKAEISWAQTPGTDQWQATLPAYDADGDYILTIRYQDLSANPADIRTDYGETSGASGIYVSNQITVDKTDPVIQVSYSPNQVIHQINERAYFDAVQTATITVTEHNFRADDMESVLQAKNVTGEDVETALLSTLAAHLRNRGSWTKNGDTYTAAITFSADANYRFAVDCTDLARRRASESVPQKTDVFTVDTTAPTGLGVSYSTSLLETVLESVTFGFYNAKMTVTLTAEDETAGVYRFAYSYIKSAGVSEVNAQLLNQAIESAEIQYADNGKTATASFEIPKMVLQNDNQFNGVVAFDADDRSENGTEKTDAHRVVVDNITPQVTVAYNEPVRRVDEVSYYAEDIQVTLTVDEANFYSQDVEVSVAKNGEKMPTEISWVDNNADVHIGTFPLTGDGDYIVNVRYKDRSENETEEYTSNQLTIDTQIPTIHVDGIANESANNAKIISFTITAEDVNFDAASFQPQLTAIVLKDGRTFDEITILNEDTPVPTGEWEYSYTIDIPNQSGADGIYTLACQVTDMSGNAASEIIVTDSGSEPMETVMFSVNRYGSTFMLDANTSDLVNTFYVQDVFNDVVLVETNADPIQSYKVTMNGRELEDAQEYYVEKDEKQGNWKKYTYNIGNTLCADEGEYRVVVATKDKAMNNSYSDIKSAEINYVVDRTAPQVTIAGLQEGGRYQVDAQRVTLIPRDDGGRLRSVQVIVAEGDETYVPLELSGDALLDLLDSSSGKLTFDIPSGYNQSVQILCSDYAQDQNGNTNYYDETFYNVTVSTNAFVIFYANKPLFFGTMIGVFLVAAGALFLLAFRRRKRQG